MAAGVERDRLRENLATVDAGLTATGGFASLGRQTPRSSFELRGAWQRLSDRNTRRRASLSAARTLGLRGLRGVLWIDHLGYDRRAADYFAPSGFTRVDAGAEYIIQFSAPRFRHDRRRELTIGYLLGTDDRRERYQHPTLRLAYELVRGLALDFSAGAIRSDVYDDQTLTIGLRIGGGSAY